MTFCDGVNAPAMRGRMTATTRELRLGRLATNMVN